MNWLPLPSSLVASSRPPWSSMMRRAKESPSPVPFPLVVKNGRKIFGSTSGGIPLPVSVTVSGNRSTHPRKTQPRTLPPLSHACTAFSIRFNNTW